VPDTPLITSAIEYARENSEPYLFNHVMRSWLFAVSLAQLNQNAHDSEVLAVATILHDIGLAEAFNGPLRFEVEGANAARKFGRSAGLDERRCQLSVVLRVLLALALLLEVRGRGGGARACALVRGVLGQFIDAGSRGLASRRPDSLRQIGETVL
jgi:HD domain